MFSYPTPLIFKNFAPFGVSPANGCYRITVYNNQDLAHVQCFTHTACSRPHMAAS